ncbi:MAG TPA: lipase maturation factor family protein [Gemmatimonadales bacterium]|nr:lipase maturation factor family protein [Gemmatimonadales bacterium]
MSAAAPTYVLSRWLFLRLLGLVYLVAFASLAVQIVGLVGAHGLLPAAQFLQWARSIYGPDVHQMLPTIFWFGASDAALRGVAWAGAGLSLLVILDVAPLVTLAVLWVLYLSLTIAGQDFLGFQWDALLLEAGLLAVLWAPGNWLPLATRRMPSPLVRWVLVLLVVKLLFLSGITKLLSGDPTWRHATALEYHFFTQPLPTWLGWYAAKLPDGVLRAMTAGSVAVEVIAPWLLLAPARLRRVRLAGASALVLLQLGIAATGNYGFFNLLAVVLLVPALDDATLSRWLPVRIAAPERESEARRFVIAFVAPALLGLSFLSFAREIAYTVPRGRAVGYFPRWAGQALGVVAPFRAVNGYGLFRVMTTERPELVIEGSNDDEHWSEYVFRYKPGPLDRRPSFVAPHQPRLDWQMWFAALDPRGSAGWLSTLLDRLRAGTPEVLALLGRNPFPDAPPRYVRVVGYEYRFSTAEERRRTGAWWAREALGPLFAP